MQTRILTAESILSIIGDTGLDQFMDEVIHELSAVFRASLDPGAFQVPQRDGFSYQAPGVGLVEWMPLLQTGADVLIKVVGYHPDNPLQRRLPTVLSSLFQFDTKNGHLKQIADGTLPTSIRTGAASAVASRVLAKPDSQTLGLIGAGAQAVTQLHALSRVFPLREVLVFDVDKGAEESFSRRCSALGLMDLKIRAAGRGELMAQSDIVCTVTSVAVGEGPVFEDCQVKPWLHVNAVGSDFPGKTELPAALLNRSHVFPDFRAQALHEGECQRLAPDQIGDELPLLVRSPEAYEHLKGELTVFDSTGYALEDHAVLAVVERHANRLRLGQDLALESTSDPHDPYAGIDKFHSRVVQLDHTHAGKALKQG